MASSLPTEWTENIDPSSGNKYYHNTVTGETTWDRPSGQTSASASSLPDGWTEHSDPSSGKMYYFHSTTGRTSWSMPVAEIALPAGWSEHDDGTGRKYYANSTTGETTWTRPVATDPLQVGWSEHTDPSSGKLFFCEAGTNRTTWTRPDVKKDEAPLPSGWSEVPDPTSGKNFFYNATTGETTWTRPIDHAAKSKGSGKGGPPPKAAKGTEKGGSWRDKQANQPWSPALAVGSNVMCKLPGEETDEFRRLFHARVGERLGQYLEKEGTVGGWDNVRSMWAVDMMDGSVWYFQTHHLDVRDPRSRQWVPAQDSPIESRSLAPDKPQAKKFEWSAIINALLGC